MAQCPGATEWGEGVVVDNGTAFTGRTRGQWQRYLNGSKRFSPTANRKAADTLKTTTEKCTNDS